MAYEPRDSATSNVDYLLDVTWAQRERNSDWCSTGKACTFLPFSTTIEFVLDSILTTPASHPLLCQLLARQLSIRRLFWEYAITIAIQMSAYDYNDIRRDGLRLPQDMDTSR